MVKCAGQVLTKGDKPVVAVTLMGVTNTGAVAAVEELEKMGLEVIGSMQQESAEHHGRYGCERTGRRNSGSDFT